MTLKIKKLTIGVGFFSLLLFGSACKNYLDLEPLDGIVRQEYWKTKEDLQASLNGCYSSLVTAPTGISDRPIPLSIFLWGELRADMVTPTEASTTTEQKDIKDIVNYNILPTNTLVTWSAFYRTINYCNQILDYAPSVKKSDPTLTDEDEASITGQALAIRSLMYFYLVRTFRDVPLKLVSVDKDSDVKNIGKTDGAKVIAQIIEDLKIAQKGVPEVLSTTNLLQNKGKFTKLGITALLADVYLWNEDYANCIVQCDLVLDYAKQHPTELGLIPVSSSWYTTVFETGGSRETVFEIAHSVNNPFGAYLISSGKKLLASAEVSTDIFPRDPTDPSNLKPDIRADISFNLSSSSILKQGTSDISFNNFQVYRLSDLMLMKAEALAFTAGRGAEAIAIVNDLRLARQAVAVTAQNPDPTVPEGVANYVLAERAREFAFEGKRWFDLLRYAKRGNYANVSYLEDVVNETVLPSSLQSALAKIQDHDSHYLPINQSDLLSDNQLVQNPFYTR